mgnify:CR=1 FL=1
MVFPSLQEGFGLRAVHLHAAHVAEVEQAERIGGAERHLMDADVAGAGLPGPTTILCAARAEIGIPQQCGALYANRHR